MFVLQVPWGLLSDYSAATGENVCYVSKEQGMPSFVGIDADFASKRVGWDVNPNDFGKPEHRLGTKNVPCLLAHRIAVGLASHPTRAATRR